MSSVMSDGCVYVSRMTVSVCMLEYVAWPGERNQIGPLAG
jgi:hypothetical protein